MSGFLLYMLSFEAQYTLWQQLTSDSDASNLAMAKTLIHEGQRKLQAELGIYYTEVIRTFTTVTDAITGTSYKSYPLPENFKSLSALYVTSGTTQYPAELVQDEEKWRVMSATTTQSTSNYLTHCFIRPDRIELYPIPSSALTATMIYRTTAKDNVNDDYTTGTITTLANGASAVTGLSTVWTSGMVGRYFKIDADAEWYRISAFTSVTAITLASEYQGTSIAAGTSAYTIGDMPITPSDTHELPVYYACWKYFIFRKDLQMARECERMWKEGLRDAQTTYANRSSSNITNGYSSSYRGGFINPNYFPLGMS